MQKVFRRAVLAKNQAKRKARIVAAKDRRQQWKADFREQVAMRRIILDEANDERKNRREDWMRGPLAPRRDVGDRRELYGSINAQRLRMPKVQPDRKSEYINIAPGDRVCVVRGRDRGKIGKVLRIDADTESVVVDGLNIFDMEFPSYALMGENDSRPYRPYPLPFPLDDVRLVVPLDDPDTGTVKDVVVKHVYGGEPILEQPYGSTTPGHTRYISGLDIEIPWPESEVAEYKDEAIDTLRFQVDEKTYLPSLLQYPIPSTLIDELRNKYSKFRTRHDPEWVAEKKELDVFQEWQRNRKMVTPMTEFMAQRVGKKLKERELNQDEVGNSKMSEATTNFIENYMASQRQDKLTAASVSPSPPAA